MKDLLIRRKKNTHNMVDILIGFSRFGQARPNDDAIYIQTCIQLDIPALITL